MTEAKKTKEDSQFLDFQSISSVDDRITEVVDMPEWGGKIEVRALSVAELNEIETAVEENNLNATEHGYLLLRAGISKPKLSESEVRVLGEKSLGAVGKVLSAINRVNEFTHSPEDVKARFQD